MNIHLHIERLVLDGVGVEPGSHDVVQAAVEQELTRLLTEGSLAPHVVGGGAIPRVQGGAMGAPPVGDATQLGNRIAQSVYGGIGK